MSSKTKATTTTKEAKPSLVPKLRFPEFREADGWHNRPLKTVFLSISNGLALEQGSEITGYRVTRIETISAGTIDLAKVGLIQTTDDITAYRLRVGDILLSNINSVAHIGKSVFVDRDYDLYHGMNLLRLEVNKNHHDAKFIFYAINTDWIRASLRERANKAVNQASINQTELGKTEVSLPRRPEQQKIAECLSSVDELMAAQARKVDALKTHKKGLMQQLFPREGETQPRLRFPEFQNAGEWVAKPLGTLATRVTAKNVLLSQSRVLTNSAEYGVVDQGSYFDREIVTKSSLGSYYIVDIGDFVYNPRVSTLAPVGPVSRNNLGIGVMSPLYTVLRFETQATDFFAQLFKTTVWHPYLKDVSNSGARHDRMSITAADFMSLPLLVPSPAEQHRVASCLSSLDALISAETQKLEALKNHKTGLMQQLFPSREAVEA